MSVRDFLADEHKHAALAAHLHEKMKPDLTSKRLGGRWDPVASSAAFEAAAKRSVAALVSTLAKLPSESSEISVGFAAQFVDRPRHHARRCAYFGWSVLDPATGAILSQSLDHDDIKLCPLVSKTDSGTISRPEEGT
jgi:hypothetical protein